MNLHAPARTLALPVAGLLVLLAGCSLVSTGRRPAAPPAPVAIPPVTATPPADIAAIPDAVPRNEPRSRNGNPPFYDVLGRRYTVLPSATGYVERGVASWYGPGFHGVSTSVGEPYDMYAMTAAHKTLPLPCYARVTNLLNGRTVVVRINDRGPFVANRIIDLSYTAAAKLDMLRAGTAMVEVRVVTPDDPQSQALTRANESPPPTLYVQAGAFAVPDNAQALLLRLQHAGMTNVFILPPPPGSHLYRVRVGPVASVVEFDSLAARLATLGVPDARLAND
ncbi:MAG TPA: septal ring lytic transglycosylase RlpA family protein [Steroidobacteraceae bacterium]|jgi:rare lipoprotein A|nr:septal ring lytic transglycosylase RlpA family protein [Steroidobacteraceae bacterium]